MALVSYPSLVAVGPRAQVPRTNYWSYSRERMGSLGQPYDPSIAPTAKHPHLISQLSFYPLPYKVLTPDLEGKRGGEDWTQDSVPQGHTAVAALGGILVGMQASARLPGVSLPHQKSRSSPLTCLLGPQTQKSLQPQQSHFGRCNWGERWHRGWCDPGSAGPPRALIQAAEGKDKGWAEGVSRLATGQEGS